MNLKEIKYFINSVINESYVDDTGIIHFDDQTDVEDSNLLNCAKKIFYKHITENHIVKIVLMIDLMKRVHDPKKYVSTILSVHQFNSFQSFDGDLIRVLLLLNEAKKYHPIYGEGNLLTQYQELMNWINIHKQAVRMMFVKN